MFTTTNINQARNYFNGNISISPEQSTRGWVDFFYGHSLNSLHLNPLRSTPMKNLRSKNPEGNRVLLDIKLPFLTPPIHSSKTD